MDDVGGEIVGLARLDLPGFLALTLKVRVPSRMYAISWASGWMCQGTDAGGKV
jgi:hypothetical protein